MPRGTARPFALVAQLLALIPFALLLFLILQYRVNVPEADEWDFIPLVEKSIRGTLTLGDFWAQHGPHRHLFPKALLVVCAWLTRWDVTFLLLLSVAGAAATWAALHRLAKGAFRALGNARAPGLAAVLSLFLFSPAQYENWLWGMQVQVFLTLWAVVSGVVALSTPPAFRWAKVWVAFPLGFLGTYSYSTGLLFWPLGFWILWNNSFQDRAERRKALSSWVFLGGAVLFSYSWKFHLPRGFDVNGASAGRPWEYVGYILNYLGMPVAGAEQAGAAVAGGIGLGLFGVLGWLVRRRLPFQWMVPTLALGLFSIGSALLTGIGRAGFGIRQALSSRYVTFGQLLWIADFLLLAFLLGQEGVRRRRFAWGLTGFAWVAIGAAVVSGYPAGIRGFQRHHAKHSYVRAQILAPSRNEEFYRRISPVRRSSLEEGIVILRKRRLSAFAETTGAVHPGTVRPPSGS